MAPSSARAVGGGRGARVRHRHGAIRANPSQQRLALEKRPLRAIEAELIDVKVDQVRTANRGLIGDQIRLRLTHHRGTREDVAQARVVLGNQR